MEKMKQIMYGVTDFALIRAENGYFVDRTALIRELERTRYALFLRPSRGRVALPPALQQDECRAYLITPCALRRRLVYYAPISFTEGK